MTAFSRYIGIDYSGAETATASLKGLRVYMAEGANPPAEVPPPPTLRKYWTRRAIAEWLVEQLAEDIPTLVGIDHGFSFPLRYFEAHALAPDWPAFLDDFQRHWPTDDDFTYVDFVREGVAGNGAARMGNARWRRLTEERAGRAKSVFHFDVQGSVAKSTHSGIPWLRFIRQRQAVHFWPFDGWGIPHRRSAIAEVYPRLWSSSFADDGRTQDQHDAFSIAAWLSHADRDGRLAAFLKPDLSPAERAVAQVEGWILGVPGPAAGRKSGAPATGSKPGRQTRTRAEPDRQMFPDFVRALAFASRKHSRQRRKDAGASPYINHPIALVSILAVEAGIHDRDTLCAALLHDTIEDTDTSVEELVAAFGVPVAALVQEVTDDKTLPKEERKARQVEHAAHLSPKARVVKLADKIANLRDVADSPPIGWSIARRQEYFDWAKQVVDRIPDPPADLLSLFMVIYDRRP